jgi:hypothetical protein
MEPLWSPAGASAGNRWQTLRLRDRRRHAETVAVGCVGKEGVNGSSPLEGFLEAPAQQQPLLSVKETFRSGGVHETSTAPTVSELPMPQPLSPSGFAGSAATST